MHRDRITLLLLSATLSIGAVALVGCTSSEPVNTGSAGSNGGGSAGANGGGSAGANGSAGAAGSTGGAPGATAGANGGSAGANGGSAGANGSAGAMGTAGGAGGTSGAMLSFANDIYPIVTAKCMPCHTKTPVDGNLDMTTEMTAYTSLLGTANPVTGGVAKTDTGCKLLDAKKLRVEPGMPTPSYLYIKISHTDAQLSAQNCGPAMPKTGSNLTLTTAQIQMFSDWITQGGKP
jgi:hypothetical protein